MSAVFFLNERAQVLLQRNFRGDVPLSCMNQFSQLLQTYETPCFCHDGVHYVYIRHADLIIVCVSSTPSLNVVAMLHFLTEVVKSFEVFVKNVAVESVIDNFVVLYELLDEMMDFGYVQTTDHNLLEEYVTQSGYELEVSQAVATLTDAISWRPPGIWYKKNELFLDCVETLNMQISLNNNPSKDRKSLDPGNRGSTPSIPESRKSLNENSGTRVHAEIHGVLKLKTFLSGMPILKLGLNSRESVAGLSFHRASRYVVLSDIRFHQCVDLDKYDQTQTIEFIPPDGQFDLLHYRCIPPMLKLFKIEPDISVKLHSRIIIKCYVRAEYKRRQQCRVSEFRFPVPSDCDSPRWKASMGTVVYVPEQMQVVWRVPNLSGGQEATVHAELSLPATGEDEPDVRPIEVKFEMPGTALSGLQIRHLKIEEPNLKYQALPWVRYLSKSGDFEVRDAK